LAHRYDDHGAFRDGNHGAIVSNYRRSPRAGRGQQEEEQRRQQPARARHAGGPGGGDALALDAPRTSAAEDVRQSASAAVQWRKSMHGARSLGGMRWASMHLHVAPRKFHSRRPKSLFAQLIIYHFT
jgi:hypothetical protein